MKTKPTAIRPETSPYQAEVVVGTVSNPRAYIPYPKKARVFSARSQGPALWLLWGASGAFRSRSRHRSRIPRCFRGVLPRGGPRGGCRRPCLRGWGACSPSRGCGGVTVRSTLRRRTLRSCWWEDCSLSRGRRSRASVAWNRIVCRCRCTFQWIRIPEKRRAVLLWAPC